MVNGGLKVNSFDSSLVMNNGTMHELTNLVYIKGQVRTGDREILKSSNSASIKSWVRESITNNLRECLSGNQRRCNRYCIMHVDLIKKVQDIALLR